MPGRLRVAVRKGQEALAFVSSRAREHARRGDASGHTSGGENEGNSLSGDELSTKLVIIFYLSFMLQHNCFYPPRQLFLSISLG